ncbi:pentapeptide repeat-containing protein [Oxynema sp. CENA135]|uniref:pentapeptide repeat-containing protein n=1 Tax=Oxynema sp. CENA135 TaxID=984206 RepID=UPI00190D4C31|nr:pentapeptide repeat-containing protein [Oxynema sp. CENA135]MBK4732952.1 pentapeptide repeat-containing protein [Oxynema sp. CENA135]
MSDLEQWYRVLDLDPGASKEEINQAYKDLVFIWHPDRIPKENERLRQKAEEKLKQLNQAREQLRAHLGNGTAPQANATPPKRPHYKSPYQSSTYARSRDSYRPPYSDYARSSQSQSWQSSPRATYKRNSYSQQPPSPTGDRYPSEPPKPPSPQPDLAGSDFRGANFKEKDLSGRNLSYANLSHADLSDAFLHKINLTGATLEHANLFRANLLQATLTKANLRSCNLIGADLSGADLRGADLRGAKVGSNDRIMVKLTGANLRGAILPDGTIHS